MSINPTNFSLPAGGITAGEVFTITLGSAADGVTHSLSYTVLAGTGGTQTSGSLSLQSSVVPLAALSAIPCSTTGTVRITLTTMNGSTAVGSRTHSCVFKAPVSAVPTLTVGGVSQSGVPAAWGLWLRSISVPSVTCTAAGVYGSSIASATLSGGGCSAALSEPQSGFTLTADCAVLSAGSITFTVTVTDTRGRTASATVTQSVTDYSNARLTGVSAVRSDGSGTADPGGAYAKVLYTRAYTAVGSNSDTLTVSGGVKGGTLTEASGTPITGGMLIPLGLTGTDTGIVELTYGDSFGSNVYVLELPPALRTLHLRSEGKGVGIGRLCDTDSELQVGWDTLIDGDLEVTGRLVCPGVPAYRGVAASTAFDASGLTASGVYRRYANKGSNFPVTDAGILYVLVAGDLIYEEFIYGSGIKRRLKSGGAWGSWS